MRVIQIEVSDNKIDTAKQTLNDEGIDYRITDIQDESGENLIEFPIPRQAVEYVLDELREAGVGVDDEYRVNLHAEVAKTKNVDSIIERFVKGEKKSNYISREELIARARDSTSSSFTYYLMTLLGVIVATSGLLLNSPAVVVGSMVVAPQLGAALMASVGIVTNEREMIVSGFLEQIAGLGLGLVGATAFATLLRSSMLVTPTLNIATIAQIGGRTSPGPLAIVVGFAAGAAAVVSLATHDSPSGALVGVMVSAALIPAAATAGLGIAWNYPRVALGATVLLVINLVTINIAGPFVLWLMGYRPKGWEENPIEWVGNPQDSLQTMKRYTGSVVAILLLIGAMSTGGAAFTQQVTYEQTAKSAIDDVLEQNKYNGVQLMKVTVEKDYLDMGRDAPTRVNVVIGEQNGTPYPKLATQIQKEIMDDAGIPVTVSVTMNTRKQDTSKAHRKQPMEKEKRWLANSTT
ncbi:TIGR00341 family protein [Halomicrococcus sp. NG-SE-24]|uniref:TIGR00341 family protein n=1 Tax=Halomicrococcus sp. NG-SE-24 TaxID=3436928 RepID=UPI003D973DE9